MGHESARWDRGEYVEFHCENLEGMDRALQNLLHAREDFDPDSPSDQKRAMKLLCEDSNIAAEYYAPSVQFSKWWPKWLHGL